MQSWSNVHKIHFQSTMEGFPIIKPAPYKKMDEWIRIKDVLSFKGDKAITGVQFFVDDYQFERCYTHPKKWINELKQFGAVVTPDFSMYTDFALPIQKYNKFRNQWLGALWQRFGLTVYPTIVWSDDRSFTWCFEGIPRNSVVALSTVGCARSYQDEFKKGYNQMMKQLTPSKILLFGTEIEGLEGDIEYIKAGAWKCDFHRHKE